MKRVALAIVSTITGLVMLLSFKTHALGTPATSLSVTSTASGSSTPTSAATSDGSGKSAAKGSATTTKPTSTTTTRTVTGTVVETQYGPVEVTITVRAGTVTSATAVEYPDQDPRSEQINDYAVPLLNAETVKAGTANIAHVSGATYTSGGYITSLQSALNKAGL